jgi:hypothetical protein
MYSSSSGGMTENFADVFGPPGHSHLVSVDDGAAFTTSASNPHSNWAAGYDQAALAASFGFSWVSNVAVVARNTSGSAQVVRIDGIVDGRPANALIEAVEFRNTLSLRSTTFDVLVRSRFDDVAVDHVVAGEILGLMESGITTGCTRVSFCPENGVTRGQMAAFLVRALNLKPLANSTTHFVDNYGSVFEAEIEILHEHGITNGCSAIEFCPTELVTRGEMAAFLVRAFKLPAGTQAPFTDDDETVFESDIAALEASGVTSGCTAHLYCPDRVVTRGEMAAFLIRALALP